MATKTKTKIKKETDEEAKERKRQANEAVDAALATREKKGFWKTCWSIILGTITCCALFVGAIVFGAIALIVLPFALPINYVIKAIHGKGIKLPISLSDGED